MSRTKWWAAEVTLLVPIGYQPIALTIELAALNALTTHPPNRLVVGQLKSQTLVAPRGIEPRSTVLQTAAMTTSAKAPKHT